MGSKESLYAKTENRLSKPGRIGISRIRIITLVLAALLLTGTAAAWHDDLTVNYLRGTITIDSKPAASGTAYTVEVISGENQGFTYGGVVDDKVPPSLNGRGYYSTGDYAGFSTGDTFRLKVNGCMPYTEGVFLAWGNGQFGGSSVNLNCTTTEPEPPEEPPVINTTNSSIKLQPEADAYIDKAQPSACKGDLVDLFLDKGASNARRTYLRFNLSSLPKGINWTSQGVNQARLYIYGFAYTDSAERNANAYLTDPLWVESGSGCITWSNAPQPSGLIASSSIGSSGAWYYFDISQAVSQAMDEDRDRISVMLQYADESSPHEQKRFPSREYANPDYRPYLEVLSSSGSAPEITGVQIPSSAYEGDVISISFDAHDADGISSYAIFLDSVRVSGSQNAEWRPDYQSAGQHRVRLYANDTTGLSSSLERTITIINKLNVVINEISPQGRWVELYNPSGSQVSVNNWVVESSRGSAEINGSIAAGAIESIPSELLNLDADDMLLIRDSEGLLIDSVTYGSFNDGNTADNALMPWANGSIGRLPDGLDTDNEAADFIIFSRPTRGYSNSMAAEGADNDNDGYNASEDCNDNDASVHPGATEVYDGADQNCIDDAPEIISISNFTFSEDRCEGAINLSMAVKDPDNALESLSIGVDGNSSSSVQLTRNGEMLVFSCARDWNGFVELQLTAKDGSNTAGSNKFRVTVEPVNDAPVLEPIEDIRVDEGGVAIIMASATDPDGDAIIFRVNDTRFSQDDNLFFWETGYEDAGSYDINVTASDSVLSDSKTAQVIVRNINRKPILEQPINQTAYENDIVTIQLSATDPDGDALGYHAIDMPENAMLNTSTGLFYWETGYEDAGAYMVTFYAADSIDSDYRDVMIRVINVNRPPQIDDVSPEGNTSMKEGQAMQFSVTASDPDNEALAVSWFIDGSFAGSGTAYRYEADYESAGGHYVDAMVSDSEDNVTYSWHVTVENVNRAPIQDAPEYVEGYENGTIAFTITATDPDRDEVYQTLAGMPAGASFNNSLFSWTPGFEDAGVYQLTSIASDGNLESSRGITIRVLNTNRAPRLEAIAPQSCVENETLAFTASAADPDGEGVSYAAENLPKGASFNQISGEFTWTPSFAQSGDYSVRIIASDGTLNDREEVLITVIEAGNHEPELASPGDFSIVEGNALEFVITAQDVDEDKLICSASGLPEGAAFDTSSLRFSWTPGFRQSGNYTAGFSVSDGTETATASAHIEVIEAGNQAPSFEGLTDQRVTEGDLLSFFVKASDPDSSLISYWADLLPPGSAFDIVSQLFSWRPDFDQAGVYHPVFYASDGNATSSASPEVRVSEFGNHKPELEDIPDITVVEGELVRVAATATDLDKEPVAIIYSAPLDEYGEWQTGYTDSGIYHVTITATDGKSSDTAEVKITVLESGNHEPELKHIDGITVTEGEEVIVTPEASDPDGDRLSIGFSEPLNANGRWQTGYTDSGTYTATATVSDGVSSISQSLVITVLESGNHRPVLEVQGTITAVEGGLVRLDVNAYDPDGDNLSIGFSEPLDAEGAWKTQKGDAGRYTVKVFVSDGTETSSRDVQLVIEKTPYSSLSISQARIINEYVRPGDDLMVSLSLENDGTATARDLRINVRVMELGIKEGTSVWKLKPNSEETVRLSIRIPDEAEPGVYYLQISVSNDNDARRIYREFTIEGGV
ncbi:TPA: tandem-95 repeat protein [Candidatus Woesearchaeota archaeon]|nr:tandem-95 repeat protein [Candidatus Woesearchaeota archaeon]